MARTRAATYLRFLAVFSVLGATGLAASIYILAKQRTPNPLAEVYNVRAEFSAADGVIEGVGQPVNVVGVKVGQVSGVSLSDGRAIVTMEIQRDQLPRVHRNATAILEPISPLKDMQIALDPGTAAAGDMGDDGLLTVEHTRPPVPLSDLLASLDTDTRTYLTSLLASLDRGTEGRGGDLRAALNMLAPTVDQAHAVSRALEHRRVALARLVHNLGEVTKAATRDHELADVVAAGNATLDAMAREAAPLRSALAQLPETLEVTRSTLANLGPFARELDPTLDALLPAIRRLPGMLAATRPFARLGTTRVREEVRPLVRRARPLLRATRPAVDALDEATPGLVSGLKSLNYFFNELAYNPPGDDEGFLFWLAWAGHNFNSFFSAADAHGNIARATSLFSCGGAQADEQLQPILALAKLCPP